MKWFKFRVIVFKICLFSNCAMLTGLCGYFLVNGLGKSDQDLPSMPPSPSMPPMPPMPPVSGMIRDIILFFLFGLFAYQFELYSKLLDFDFTSDLKYIY
jgi:hypothetical protein